MLGGIMSAVRQVVEETERIAVSRIESLIHSLIKLYSFYRLKRFADVLGINGLPSMEWGCEVEGYGRADACIIYGSPRVLLEVVSDPHREIEKLGKLLSIVEGGGKPRPGLIIYVTDKKGRERIERWLEELGKPIPIIVEFWDVETILRELSVEIRSWRAMHAGE